MLFPLLAYPAPLSSGVAAQDPLSLYRQGHPGTCYWPFDDDLGIRPHGRWAYVCTEGNTVWVRSELGLVLSAVL